VGSVLVGLGAMSMALVFGRRIFVFGMDVKVGVVRCEFVDADVLDVDVTVETC